MYGPLKEINAVCKRTRSPYSCGCVAKRQFNSYQLCVMSKGCKFGKVGSCTMCNYGYSTSDENCIYDDTISCIEKCPDDCTSILLGSCGSILDGSEVDQCLFEKIIRKIAERYHSKRIILETSYRFIDEDILKKIKDILKNNTVDIEIGLESSNKDVLRYALNKDLDLSELIQKIKIIHGFGFEVTLNVIFGTPFLTLREQIEDSVNSIKWAIGAGADTVALFPLNIKEDTLIASMYRTGTYECAPLSGIIEVLRGLDNDELTHVVLSWTNPEELSRDYLLCGPKVCDDCASTTESFVREFMSTGDPIHRSELIERNHLCPSCSSIGHNDQSSLEQRVNRWIDSYGAAILNKH